MDLQEANEKHELTNRNGHNILSMPFANDVAIEKEAPLFSLMDENGNVRRLVDIEADILRYAVQHYHGHMSEVARRLGIGRSTLYRKLNELNRGAC